MKTISRWFKILVMLTIVLAMSCLPVWGSCGTAGSPSGEGENGPPPDGPRKCPVGAPVWYINMINLNQYVTDIPLWYDPGEGPRVKVQLHFNSLDNGNWVGLFGRGWHFDYGYRSRFSPTYGIGEIKPSPPPSSLPQKSSGGGSSARTSGSRASSKTTPVDAARVYLDASRKIDFQDDYSAGPKDIPVKEKYYHYFGRLEKIDDHHYRLHREDGTVISYTRMENETFDWYEGMLHASNFSKITSITDRWGNSLSFEHDGLRPTGITDAEGRVTTISYNSQGLIERIEDPFGRFATFEYDADLFLTRITDMNGYWTELEYDTLAAGTDNPIRVITKIRNMRGETSFYHELNRLRVINNLPPGGVPFYPAPGSNIYLNKRVTVTHPDGGKEEFYYCGRLGYGWHVSAEHYMDYIDDENNNYAGNVPKTLYYYANTSKGAREQLSRVVGPDGRIKVSYSYDYDTQLKLSESDGLQNTTYYTYNDKGRILTVKDPAKRVTTYGYAQNGLDVASISSALGTIEFEYDDDRNLVKIIDKRELTATTGDDPTGHGVRQTTMAYDGDGHLVSVTDPAGVLTQLVYSENRLAEIIRAGHQLVQYTRDAIGRVATSTDASGLSLGYSYDNLNRVTSIIYPDGKSEQWSYSGCCPWIMDSHTDRGGRSTYYEYDSRNRLVQVTEPGKKVTRFVYDLDGNLVELIDSDGKSTRFQYDEAGRLVARVYADQTTWRYQYDDADRLVVK